MTEKKNALWFFVALLGGGLVVFGAKSAFANAWIAAGVAGGVVLLLMGYYWLNDKDAPEEEGDNVYYLGLLFTLLSLMFTLVELFGGDTDARGNAERIRVLLENFGIALTSTVVGIFGRVWLLNWQWNRSSPTSEADDDGTLSVPPPPNASVEELEGFNRHLLGRIARDLTDGANALARFHRIVRSHATDTEEILHSHSQVLRRESVEFRDALQSNADSFAQELKRQAESSFQTVGRSLGEVGQQAGSLLEQLQSAHEGHSEQVVATARSFHDEFQSTSRQSLEALRRNFDTAAQQAEALPERLRAAHASYLDEIRVASRSVYDEIQSASSQNLQALQQNQEATAQQTVGLVQQLSGANERIETVLQSLETGLARAGDASAALGKSADLAAKSSGGLEAELGKLRGVLGPLNASAPKVSGVLDAMGELEARIREGRDAEQSATAVRQIGEIFEAITVEGAAARDHAASATELMDALKIAVQNNEAEIRRTTDALHDLANEAEARADDLRQPRGSGFGFWNRNG